MICLKKGKSSNVLHKHNYWSRKKKIIVDGKYHLCFIPDLHMTARALKLYLILI
jgi:hypothetical protein